MPLGVERLVGACRRAMPTRLLCDPCPRRERTLVVRIDIVDGDADVLALDAAALGADRAVGALRSDPDHAAAELHEGVMDHAVRALHPGGRNLSESERTLEEVERGADVRIWKLGDDGQ